MYTHVGRGGSVIKQLQKESQTRINLKDDKEESGDELTDEEKPQIRTMVIRGSRERIKHAEVLIKNIIDEQPVREKISVEIPQKVIGRIIGKGGKTIRQLCKISGNKFKDCCKFSATRLAKLFYLLHTAYLFKMNHEMVLCFHPLPIFHFLFDI